MGKFFGASIGEWGQKTALPGGGGYEDLTTFTLVDPSGNASVNLTTITITGMIPAWTDFYMYKDYGAGYFGANWKINFEVQITAIPQANARYLGIIKTDTGFGNDIDTNGPGAWAAYDDVEALNFEFNTGDDSYAKSFRSVVMADNLFCTLERISGDPGNVLLTWYTDATRTTEINNVSRPDIPLEYFDTHRYLMIGFSYRVEYDKSVFGSYIIKNVEIISH